MNRKNRSLKHFTDFTLVVLITIGTIILLPDTLLWSADTSSGPVILEKIRAGRHDQYSSVVFEFGNPFQFDKPVIQHDEVRFKLKNVNTTLAEYREYKNSESWVRLERAGNDLNVRIGLLKSFLRFNYSVLPNPERLVIKLYRDERPDVLSSEKTAADPENNVESPLTVVKEGLPEKDPKDKKPEAAKTTPPKKNIHPNLPTKTTSTKKNRKVVHHPSKQQLLTLNFYQGDIQEILSGLAIQQKINIITSKDVSGKVSVHLYQVPLDRAIDAVCRAGGFKYNKHKNVYFVFKSKVETDPQAGRLQMRIFKLEYADIEKIQGVLEAIPGIRMIKIHEPTKTIVVEDTPENIKKVETLIKYWDAKPKQVMIEAKLLEVSLTDDMSLGVNWERVLGDVRIGTGGFSRATIPTGVPVSPVPSSGAGIFANIITAAGTRHQFAAAIDALQAKTKINTLSTPKILAIHGKPAKVQVGGQQGYAVTTVSNGIATETIKFIDTGTILEITPYIDHENNILLKVKPTINSVKIEEGIPVVSSTLATTWMMAKNGETVFIGGLIQNTNTKTRTGIPCLGNIPGLGLLFGKTSNNTGKSELVILITPQIIEDGPPNNQEAIEKVQEKEKYLKSKSSSPETLLNPFPAKEK